MLYILLLSLILFFLAVVIFLGSFWDNRSSHEHRTENSLDENFLSDALLRKVKSRRDYTETYILNQTPGKGNVM